MGSSTRRSPDHHGALYKLVVNGEELPDPYARYLPAGVSGSRTGVRISLRFGETVWASRRPLDEQVIYELHVGTFTEGGTYESARARLPYLAELGNYHHPS